MSATKFLLGDNAAVNYVISADHSYAENENQVIWSVGSSEKT